MKRPTELPEWFKLMALDATLDIHEVIALFGYANANSLHRAVSGRHFPKPDKGKPRTTKHGVTQLVCWSKRLVLTELRRRLA